MKAELVLAANGYSLVFEDKDGKYFWLKITDEEAEIVMENLAVEVMEIPF